MCGAPVSVAVATVETMSVQGPDGARHGRRPTLVAMLTRPCRADTDDQTAPVGVLRSAGFRLDPTGRNPRHFTVVFDDLDGGVEALVSCEHLNWVNPYHED